MELLPKHLSGIKKCKTGTRHEISSLPKLLGFIVKYLPNLRSAVMPINEGHTCITGHSEESVYQTVNHERRVVPHGISGLILKPNANHVPTT